jgi:hypothetical protein
MAGMTTSTGDKILKVDYLPPVRELLNNSTIFLQRLEKDTSTQQVGGKTFTIPLHKTNNEAAAVGRAESGTLPTAGQQGYTQAVVPNKFIYGRMQVSGPVIAATRSNAYAFVDAVTSEMQGLVRNTRRNFNRELHGDGTDALATLVSGAGGTSLVVDDGLGNIFTHLPAGDAITVDLLDASASYVALTSGITITRGASNGTTGFAATASSAISGSAADGDIFVVAGTKDLQPMGLAGIVDDQDPPLLSGGLHGLPVATEPKWVAQVTGSDTSLVDISFPLIQTALSNVAMNSDFTEDSIEYFLMNFPVRNKYVELCVNERGFYNLMTLDGGWEAVEYNGKGFVADPQCRQNRIYGIVPETIKLYRASDFDWIDKDGAVLCRVANQDAYEATMFHYGDLGVSQRNANLVIKGIRQ